MKGNDSWRFWKFRPLNCRSLPYAPQLSLTAKGEGRRK